MEEPNWSYIAGLLEGEGEISIHRITTRKEPEKWKHYRAYQPRIGIAMTDRGPVEYVATTWGSTVNRDRTSSTYKTVFRSYCPAAKVREVASRILPYFRSARRRRELNLILSLRESIEEIGHTGRRSLSLSVVKYRHWLYEQMQIAKGV